MEKKKYLVLRPEQLSGDSFTYICGREWCGRLFAANASLSTSCTTTLLPTKPNLKNLTSPLRQSSTLAQIHETRTDCAPSSINALNHQADMQCPLSERPSIIFLISYISPLLVKRRDQRIWSVANYSSAARLRSYGIDRDLPAQRASKSWWLAAAQISERIVRVIELAPGIR